MPLMIVHSMGEMNFPIRGMGTSHSGRGRQSAYIFRTGLGKVKSAVRAKRRWALDRACNWGFRNTEPPSELGLGLGFREVEEEVMLGQVVQLP